MVASNKGIILSSDLNSPKPKENHPERLVINFCRELLTRRSRRLPERYIEDGFQVRTGGERSLPIKDLVEAMLPFLSSVKCLRIHITDMHVNEDGTRVVSHWQVRGRFMGLKAARSCRTSLSFGGVAVWSMHKGGKLTDFWIDQETWEWLRRLYQAFCESIADVDAGPRPRAEFQRKSAE